MESNQSIDAQSKIRFIQFLRAMGFLNIEPTDDKFGQFYYLDIIADYGGRHVGFELKQREYAHDDFNDIMCEQSKVDKAKTDISNKVYDKIYVVNMFLDNFICMSDILNGTLNETFSPTTTAFENKEYKYKQTVSFPQDIKYYFSLTKI